MPAVEDWDGQQVEYGEVNVDEADEGDGGNDSHGKGVPQDFKYTDRSLKAFSNFSGFFWGNQSFKCPENHSGISLDLFHGAVAKTSKAHANHYPLIFFTVDGGYQRGYFLAIASNFNAHFLIWCILYEFGEVRPVDHRSSGELGDNIIDLQACFFRCRPFGDSPKQAGDGLVNPFDKLSGFFEIDGFNFNGFCFSAGLQGELNGGFPKETLHQEFCPGMHGGTIHGDNGISRPDPFLVGGRILGDRADDGR